MTARRMLLLLAVLLVLAWLAFLAEPGEGQPNTVLTTRIDGTITWWSWTVSKTGYGARAPWRS